MYNDKLPFKNSALFALSTVQMSFGHANYLLPFQKASLSAMSIAL